MYMYDCTSVHEFVFPHCVLKLIDLVIHEEKTKEITNRKGGMEMWSFLSCLEPRYESEAKGEASHRKISFHSYANKTNFLMKSFALSLAFIMRFNATRKWPVIIKFGERGFNFFQELLLFWKVISNT